MISFWQKIQCKLLRDKATEGKKVVLALLTWNTRDISKESFHALIKEAELLNCLGYNPLVCVCDNGSIDGTQEEIASISIPVQIPCKLIFNSSNLGSSIARNQIINYMLEVDADYLLLMDGDIEIIPFSSFAMLNYLDKAETSVGCLGADCNFNYQTTIRAKATKSLFRIVPAGIKTTNLISFTQYGLYRKSVFQKGIMFDEESPFDEPGWGFEDNDLAFQMYANGFINQCFTGITYLHRAAGSSVRVMYEQDINAETAYQRRKYYMIHKWSDAPEVVDEMLNVIYTSTFRY